MEEVKIKTMEEENMAIQRIENNRVLEQLLTINQQNSCFNNHLFEAVRGLLATEMLKTLMSLDMHSLVAEKGLF